MRRQLNFGEERLLLHSGPQEHSGSWSASREFVRESIDVSSQAGMQQRLNLLEYATELILVLLARRD
jgi:hypothetical protein